MNPSKEHLQRLQEQLENSPDFCKYRDAFRRITNLPLRFMPAGQEWCLSDHAENQSSFCETLNLHTDACQACRDTNQRLSERAARDGLSSCHCFAGLTATAVPVKVGGELLGYLRTGQVFREDPQEEDFQTIASHLRLEALAPELLDELRSLYLSTQTIDAEKYTSMIVLLEMLAARLSQLAEELSTRLQGEIPHSIERALAYLQSHLEDPLNLAEVARHSGLSESHFCRLFKEHTGQTMTSYVTRARVAWARRELLAPASRVSDVAFKVGFQSLSQFNRAFIRYEGQSPTEYRREKSRHLQPSSR